MHHMWKHKLSMRLKNCKGIWFHIVGLACLFWFLIRVVPAPHRSQYPCQQIAIPIAFGYIAFWSILFHGVTRWIHQAKHRITAVLPACTLVFALLFSLSGMVFAGNFFPLLSHNEPWTPLVKEPLGIPKGVNPGRVVWIWDANATEEDLKGYWWEEVNNNQEVIDAMMSEGIQQLAGETTDAFAWESLFRYFNRAHGFEDVGYQPGEKIVIKINMNNGYVTYQNPYTWKDNQRDASPSVIKSLLRQLVNIVGVPQEDITVYDASRPIANWFYDRVYYRNYESTLGVLPEPEFPEVNFEDALGGAPGRQQVQPSEERVYFYDGSGLYRTLPTCVVEAKYYINVPLLKKHPINNGVTLSGKNMFGTWIEPVSDVHPYLESGMIMGNLAPQTDLLAHRELGGKTLLFLGDGMYGTLKDHREISKFHMYPFNNDWTSSLFFSQDPVAIDSVMFDFLYTEGPAPIEGSQNYLHQAAEPPAHAYDPEGDGVYLEESLGVHEHWDTSVDIFSPDRYSGPEGGGIDFVAVGKTAASADVVITSPSENHLYLFGSEVTQLPWTVVIGPIEITAEVHGETGSVERIDFLLDGTLQHSCSSEPYRWSWTSLSFGSHTVTVKAYCQDFPVLSSDMIFWKLL
jgi:hypothetical protein